VFVAAESCVGSRERSGEQRVRRRSDWQDAQRRYYEDRKHAYLEPGRGGLYARNLAQKLFDRLGLPRTSHGLEIGCGAGRFTIPLLEHFDSLEVSDLSSRQLGLLGEELARHRIDGNRCTLHRADIDRLDEFLPAGRFDFLIGVFVLHHLHDPTGTVRRLFELVRPGGRIIILEPNRWNPLYTLQILFLRDFSFREEKRLYQLGLHRLRRIVSEAGFADIEAERNGFFPPQLINRFGFALPLERRLEAIRLLNPILPFLMISGTRPQ
jgi:SAM-dependent methyltransferase